MVAEDKDVEKWSDLYYRRFGVKQHWSKNQEKKTVTIKREPFFKQLSILISRYMLLIKNDTQRLLMILLQPILIGLLLSFVASDTVFEIYNSSKSILFALSCAGIWMGLFNSIQEICKERIILKREYMANLRLDAYVVSKFAVQLLISMIQAILITAVFVITVGKPESGVLFGSSVPELIVTMCLTIFSSAGIGLIVSSISRNTDKAMTVAPFLLIIQLLFSGILFELNDVTEKISYLTVSRWSVAALGVTSNLNELPSAGGIVRSFENVFEYTSGRLGSAWAVLGAFVIICGTASALLLRNVSKDSR
ncbi:MAG: ABC transporter permease [Oscillospiraceae bacterium]|nr:ABC transporter permease [Oscillospiraceae bacterium]